MANQEHLDILKQGVETWNRWRNEHPNVKPNLSGVDLGEANLNEAKFSRADLSMTNFSGAKLNGANFRRANIRRANLSNTHLCNTNFREANLYGANLNRARLNNANFRGANLSRADLSDTTLNEANFRGADLSDTNLSRADLNRADLGRVKLVGTNLTETNLSDCLIYGISAWDVHLTNAIQTDLIITQPDEPTITVDNLEVAQFIYLLLNNQKIREIIDTITSKLVLILGRFTPERKAVLDALRDELRKHNYSPVLFDFEKPASRDLTETVSTLAHMSRFIIADITDAKSIPQELMIIVPNLPSVPVQPLILNSQHEYGMFEHFTRYQWVLPIYRYTNEASLLQSLEEAVIDPVEQKAQELAKR
jgi:hypothetical protein